MKQIGGVGSVLVDRSGKALYSPDQEADGKIRCTQACTAFWKPLSPGSAAPSGSAGVGALGVITRPDGNRQVTENGKPLYTFSEDTPGQVRGNGFADAFNGQHFTWHAILAVQPQGSPSGAPSPSTTTNTGSQGYGY